MIANFVKFVFTKLGLRRLWYREIYLRTWHWRTLRRRVLEKYDYKCAVCNGRAYDVHHKTYDRLGRERMSDLMVLCRYHHTKAHAK